jgi:carbamoyl-phosphate synthase small subunit
MIVRAPDAVLLLEDGTRFPGIRFGAPVDADGEAVFNTSLTGYQELLTDPSYHGQIVTLTASEIGVYGIAQEDIESGRVQVSGLVVHRLTREPSNYRSVKSLDAYLRDAGVPGLDAVDTRALTRHLRTRGVMRAAIVAIEADHTQALNRARASVGVEGQDFTATVSRTRNESWKETVATEWSPALYGNDATRKESIAKPSTGKRVIAWDFGVKSNILRHLATRGHEVIVVPVGTTAAQIRELKPDGVFLSNGPGDPAASEGIIAELRALMKPGSSGPIPIGAICLGHQLVALAAGAQTFKLHFGHRGANHPVRDLRSGAVAVTSQNHGFSVRPETCSRAGLDVTHISLNDGTIEGLRHRELPIVCVQYHPEASPGPREGYRFFDEFTALMTGETREPALTR